MCVIDYKWSEFVSTMILGCGLSLQNIPFFAMKTAEVRYISLSISSLEASNLS